MPRQYNLSQIFIAVPPGADKPTEEVARKRLEDVVAKLKQKGAEFSSLAAKESDAQANNGEIGWIRDDQIRPEIRDKVAGLEKQAVTDPIRLDDGWHIVKLIDTKAAYTRPVAEVRGDLIAALRRERAALEAQAYVGKLFELNPAVINEIALTRLLGAPAK
jgi:peptidylprolyl isomerase